MKRISIKINPSTRVILKKQDLGTSSTKKLLVSIINNAKKENK